MSKFLIVTKTCDGIGVGWQLMQEGHDVKLYLLDYRFYKDIFKGILPIITNFQEGLKENPVVIFDMNGKGLAADKIKKAGYKVVGAGMGSIKGESVCDLMEDDREVAFHFIEQFDINTSEWHFFKTALEAKSFVEGSDDRWVVKPVGKFSTALTFPSKDNEELAGFLEKVEKDKLIKGGLILQKFVKGAEVSTEIFCSNGKFVKGSLNSTLETKRFMNDDKGPNTGCGTSVVWFHEENKSFREGLKKLESFVNATQYCGFLDMNAIIDEDGNYNWLEFTPRMGYSAVYAMSQALDMPMGELLYKMASGELKEVKTKEGFGTAVRVSIPPYPYESPKDPPKGYECAFNLSQLETRHEDYESLINKVVYSVSKDQVVQFNPLSKKYIPLDIYYKDKVCYTAGHDGVVMECLGYGKELKGACEDAYNFVKEVTLANMQYRTDMFENASKRYKELVSKGYA